MPRILNEQEYTEKRNEILDAAQRLVQTKGYRQMTIQDILDDLQISKGAFYHYFASKSDLLDALIERMQVYAELTSKAIMQEPGLSALEKLKRIFATQTQWKTERKDFLIALLRVWYQDNNALVRQKASAKTIDIIAPLLAEIIHQGIAEGTLATPYPEQVSEVALYILQGMSESFARLIFSPDPQGRSLRRLEQITAAYVDALERVLGAQPGSVELIDIQSLAEWFSAPGIEEQR